MQAMALVESGAADRFGLGNAELALACASHGGEPRHVETARRMLAAAGRTPDDLECGPQSPNDADPKKCRPLCRIRHLVAPIATGLAREFSVNQNRKFERSLQGI